jgi:hypothetical protein
MPPQPCWPPDRDLATFWIDPILVGCVLLQPVVPPVERFGCASGFDAFFDAIFDAMPKR